MSDQNNVTAPELKTDLHRTLKQRHLTMIGIGGAIGTGMWFASGQAISSTGPGGGLFVYVAMSILVYLLMTSLGEMATQVPLSGSFETYASKFVDPALGFAMGWNYYLSWAICITFEIVVGAKILQFWWPPDVLSPWIPSVLFFFLLFGLNAISARGFGEAEFWFAGIKVAAVIIFLVVGTLMVLGVVAGPSPGLSNWTYAIAEGGTGTPFIGGFTGILTMFLIAAFSFQGTELVGLSAGEASNPDKTIPKAINAVFWRIIFFYLGGILLVTLLVPFDDPHLLGQTAGGEDIYWMDYEQRVAYSPFTLVFKNAGITIAAHLMNLVVLTSVLSCGNSGLYCATRMLYAMAHEGKAPKSWGRTNARGVPMTAMYITAGIAAVGFIIDKVPGLDIYEFLLNASGMMGMFGWFGIAICHWRFRHAFVAQGNKVEDLKYKAKFYPAGPIIGMILCIIVILGSNVECFMYFEGDWDSWFWLLSSYFPLPLFLCLFFIYKFVMHTKFIPYEKADFTHEYRVHRKGDQ